MDCSNLSYRSAQSLACDYNSFDFCLESVDSSFLGDILPRYLTRFSVCSWPAMLMAFVGSKPTTDSTGFSNLGVASSLSYFFGDGDWSTCSITTAFGSKLSLNRFRSCFLLRGEESLARLLSIGKTGEARLIDDQTKLSALNTFPLSGSYCADSYELN